MRILVSNDDGIYARGIRVLAHRLSRDADNEVFVVAPDRERSATGHALTLHKPIRVEEIEYEGAVKGAWWTTGTPSDCVKFAVQGLLDQPPDIVISGINSGPNLGTEILYSGTVSAAMEGAILSIPGIAVSLVGRHGKHYEVAAEFVARLIKVLPWSWLPRRILLNINVPNLPAASIKGVAFTELGLREYKDHYEKRLDPRGKTYYWLAGEAVEEGETEDSDVRAVNNQKISITPVTFNMTDRQTLSQLSQWREGSSLLTSALSSTSGVAANDKADAPAASPEIPTVEGV
ncbi:MAG TPA: 5'/3'-nucleotidase SurE [Candidatus Obscuribacterales bacterium]